MNELEREIERIKGLPEKEKEELDERAKQGETVVRGGTGGNSLEAQLHLAEGKTFLGGPFSYTGAFSKEILEPMILRVDHLVCHSGL